MGVDTVVAGPETSYLKLCERCCDGYRNTQTYPLTRTAGTRALVYRSSLHPVAAEEKAGYLELGKCRCDGCLCP